MSKCLVFRYSGTDMRNVFVVNDEYDAAVCLYWLENNRAQVHSV